MVQNDIGGKHAYAGYQCILDIALVGDFRSTTKQVKGYAQTWAKKWDIARNIDMDANYAPNYFAI